MNKIDFKIKQVRKNFRLMDDTFFRLCFQNSPECVQYLLERILDKKLQIVNYRPQDSLIKLDGRGVVLDILAVDSENKFYNIEIQRNNEGSDARRARYNAAMIDATQPKENSGKYGKDLPETFIIIICEKDHWKKGQALYVFERKCTLQDNEELLLNDGLHIIYVNASYRGRDSLGQLMNDLCAYNLSDMSESVLKEKAIYFKEDAKEDIGMNDYIKEVFKEEIAEAVDKAVKKAVKEAVKNATKEAKLQLLSEHKETAKKLLNFGLPPEQISIATGLSLEVVRSLTQTA